MAEIPDLKHDSTSAEHLVPGTRKPAYSLVMPDHSPMPVLIAVPHAGRTYPSHLLRMVRRADYALPRLEDRYVDRIALEIARNTGVALLLAHAPRAMLDLNRATDDVDWDMIEGDAPGATRHSLANRRARSGLGLVPRRLPGLGEIWNARLPLTELQRRIAQVHAPYHRALAGSLEQIRNKWGMALLIDLHSMPPLRKTHRDDTTAQFVIGDRFGAAADDRIVAAALAMLGDSGARVAHNRPYAGGYVLDRHAAPGRGIHALQLEICRSLYLDREFDQPKPSESEPVAALIAMLTRLVRRIGAEVANLPRNNGWGDIARDAAE